MANGMRILLLMDNRQDTNWGSQATTNALVGLIHECFPDCKIHGLPRTACRPSSSFLRKLCLARVPSLINQRKATHPLDRFALNKLTATWEHEVEWADLVIVNGEGTLHPQPQALRWMGAISGITQRHQKPYWVVNCSASFEGPRYESLFSGFFKHAEYVAVRDPISHRLLTKHQVQSTNAVDCAFLTEPAPESEARELIKSVDIRGPFAVLTGSASVKDWPIEHQVNIVKQLQSHGLQVLYLYSDDKDEQNWKALNLDIAMLNHEQVTYQQMTTIQGLAQIMVGGRFHPTILSALVGTPFVIVPSNTHKMNGLMELLDSHDLLCDFRDSQRIHDQIEEVLANRDHWSQHLASKSQSIKHLAKLHVDGTIG